jgi:two-component system, chemotaxis family, sensor kinase CheA
MSVLELVRAAKDTEHRIETINATPVLRLRNRLLPLVHLESILGLPSKPLDDSSERFVVVSQVGNFTFGIVVDQVFDTEEIVVKPVAPILKHLSVYSGNTILGDGSVIMILDPNGVANATASVQDTEQSESTELARKGVETRDVEAMLVFRAGDQSPKAVPLSLVARLEEIAASAIEYSEGRPMVQYRGRLMPLVTVDANAALRSEGNQPVLVFADGERSMGLAVEQILDIVEEHLEIELSSDQTGRVGTAVVSGKVTEILDVSHYLKLAFKDYLKTETQGMSTTDKVSHRVLVVDDSPFFRNMLKPLLQAAGYSVTVAASGADALKLRDEGHDFDLIVSDIEMPGLTGFELAQAVRSDPKWAGLPMVALSSLASPEALEKGREVGFNDYCAKLDREELLSVLAEQLKLAPRAA